MDRWPGKNICVMGLGRSGKAAINLLLQRGASVVAFDDSQDNRVHRLGRLWGRLRYLVLELLRRRIARRREFLPRPVLLPHLSDYFELLFDRFIGRRRRRVLMLRHR